MSAAQSFNMAYARRVQAAREYGHDHPMASHAPKHTILGGLGNLHYMFANRIRHRFPFLQTYGR